MQFSRQPTKPHYRLLAPNFERYRMADSDAVNSIDKHEAMLWFTSRGDECLNCGGKSILLLPDELVIRVKKVS